MGGRTVMGGRIPLQDFLDSRPSEGFIGRIRPLRVVFSDGPNRPVYTDQTLAGTLNDTFFKIYFLHCVSPYYIMNTTQFEFCPAFARDVHSSMIAVVFLSFARNNIMQKSFHVI